MVTKVAPAPNRRKKALARLSYGDRVFDAVNYLLMSAFFILMLYPLYYVVIASVSDIAEVGLGNVILLPKGFNLDAYIQVFHYDMIWVGYGNSLIYTLLSVVYELALMLPLAYALSKKYLYARSIVTWYFLITMYFGGGIVPAYLLRTQILHLQNTVWVIVLGSVSVYYMVVTRTYFMTSIPEELYESAEIDGASQFRCFFQIALPLSTPIVAVMALFIGVSMWNSYFNAMIYIQKREMYPLQLVLRSVLLLNERIKPDSELFLTLTEEQMKEEIAKANLALSMKYSTIFISSAPLLIAYPFVQKYFVKGVMIGSLKG